MKKASAKIRRKVKTKFCREISSLEQKFSNSRSSARRGYSKVDASNTTNSKKDSK